MSRFLVGLFTMISMTAFAEDASYIHRATPKDPVYLPKTIYTELKTQLPAPPKPGSPEQKRDEDMSLQMQSSRSAADCKRAETEVAVNLDTFYVENNGPLKKSEADAVRKLINQISIDSYYFTDKMKVEFPRDRPFVYVKGLKPCVKKETTESYPSGHAALAQLMALVLGEIYPAKKEQFFKRSEQISLDRVLAGVHHLSDINAGRNIGEVLFADLHKVPKFNKELSELKAKIH